MKTAHHPPHPHLRPVFVDREEEIKTAVEYVKKFFNQESAGGRSKNGGEKKKILIFRAPPGCGKTRFLEALSTVLETMEDEICPSSHGGTSGLVVVPGKCAGENSGPYHPLRQILPREEVLSVARKIFGEEEIRQRSLVSAAMELLTEKSRKKCVVILLDDFEKADAETAELLHTMYSTGVPLPVICTAPLRDARFPPFLRETLGLLRRERLVEEKTMTPLGEDALFRIVSNALGRTPPPDFFAALIKRPEGTTRPVLSIIRDIQRAIAEEKLVLRDGKWEPPPDIGWDGVAAYLWGDEPGEQKKSQPHGKINLSPEEKTVMEIMATVGETSFELLMDLAGLAEEDLINTLESLIDKGLVSETGEEEWEETYAISHAVLQEEMLRGMSWQKKKKIHSAAYRFYMRQAEPERDNEKKKLLQVQATRHLVMAGPSYSGEKENFVSKVLEGADMALDLSMYTDAFFFLKKAAGEIDRAPPEIRAKAFLLYGMTAFFTGRFREAETSLEKSERIFAGISEGKNRYLAKAKIYRGMALTDLGRINEAEKELREALQIALATGNFGYVAWCFERLGYISWRTGAYVRAMDLFKNALVYTKMAGKTRFATFIEERALVGLGNVYLYTNRPERALEYYHMAMGRLEKMGGSAFEESRIRNNIGVAYGHMGDCQRAVEELKKAISLARKAGVGRILQAALDSCGLYLTEMGRYDEAEEHLRHALALAEEIERPVAMARVKKDLANLYLKKGEKEKAEALLREAVEIADVHNIFREKYEALLLLHQILLAENRHEEAAEIAEEMKKMEKKMRV